MKKEKKVVHNGRHKNEFEERRLKSNKYKLGVHGAPWKSQYPPFSQRERLLTFMPRESRTMPFLMSCFFFSFFLLKLSVRYDFFLDVIFVTREKLAGIPFFVKEKFSGVVRLYLLFLAERKTIVFF